MKIKQRRILFRVGEGSFAVTLPKAWINYHGLKPGDRVEVTAGEEVIICVLKQEQI